MDSKQTRVQGLFSEVRPIRSFEDIVAQIQQAISSGRLKHGDRLPNERDLGTMFRVSRATLREALRVLEGSGVVEVRRGASGGTFVTEPNADQAARAIEALIRFRGATAEDLSEFRGSFEGETAYWAAKRATPEQAARLLELADGYARAAQAPGTPWSELVGLDVAFHEQVARASQNQIRVAILLAIYGALHDASLVIERRGDMAFRAAEAADLGGIAQAISRRRVRLARQLMRKHVAWNSRAEVEDQRAVGDFHDLALEG